MDKSKIMKKVLEVLEVMPCYSAYFPDHGIGHVERILQVVNKHFAPMLVKSGTSLSPVEQDIFVAAAALHDVGMANPKVRGNDSPGSPESPSEIPSMLRSIRDNHEIWSQQFVYENWQRLGLAEETHDIVARLCCSHRRKQCLTNDYLFPDPIEPIALKHGGADVRVQLLSSMLKLADALDTDRRRTPSALTDFFVNLPERDQRYWDACKCISAVRFTDSAIVLHVHNPPAASSGRVPDAANLASWKAVDIFSELFLVLPFMLQARLPWVMVKVSLRDAEASGPRKGNFPVWGDWWHGRREDNGVDATDVQYDQLVDIATELSKRIHPSMSSDDTLRVLEVLRDHGYAIPPEQPLKPGGSPYKFHCPTSTPECKASFIETLQNAKTHIDLLCSDGLTFPPKVYEVLKDKVRPPDTVRLRVFLTEARVLHQIEGEVEGLSEEEAERKVAKSKETWSKWFSKVLSGLDEAQKQLVRQSVSFIFVTSAQFAHLKGSAVVDRRILRLNIRLPGVSSSKGALLHCEQPVNLLPIIERLVSDMEHFGNYWEPSGLS